MVYVKHSHAVLTGGETANYEAWLAAMGQGRSEAEQALLRRACEFAAPLYEGLEFLSGETLLGHALGAATIVASLRLDADSIAAAILHAVPDCLEDGIAILKEKFSPVIASLVEGVARMDLIRAFSDSPGGDKKDRAQQAESLRKMLLAMVEDIRVVLVKLSERTQTMRAIKDLDPEVRRNIAREVLEIYAPLANRLGIWHIKWELEDFAFRYQDPDLYKRIARQLDERRVEREAYIAQVIATIRAELEKAGVKAEVSGRPKHIYSIWKKMQRKRVGFEEIYDVRAVRVLVDSVAECYTALGIVHNLWQPIPKEFDDYISHPKGNYYRSLHTAVIGPEGKALEVQIRTQEMHRHAELGVAAHWRYKEGGRGDTKYEEKIAWLRQLLEWKEEVSDAGEIMEQFKSELFQDVIYVLTPQGRVIDLPAGATPIDFAYHVHTDLGHRCRGAKVDGAIVPLNTKLQNGQRVEILAAKQGGPSRDWLSTEAGYAVSNRTRTKIRHWFKYQNFDQYVSEGRDLLDKEMRRLGLAEVNHEKLAQKFGHPRMEDFLAALGRGDVTPRQLGHALQEQAPAVEEKPLFVPRATRQEQGGILVHGISKLLTSTAKCCKPLPPEPIVGFVTRGRGITVHRQDCPNMQFLDEAGRQRLIEAEWGGAGGVFPADIEVRAHDRQGLLRDISEVLSREKINVTATNTESRGGVARMRFTMEVHDIAQLWRMLTLIHEVPSVLDCKRK